MLFRNVYNPANLAQFTTFETFVCDFDGSNANTGVVWQEHPDPVQLVPVYALTSTLGVTEVRALHFHCHLASVQLGV
jgi:hypothetical protein